MLSLPTHQIEQLGQRTEASTSTYPSSISFVHVGLHGQVSNNEHQCFPHMDFTWASDPF